MMSKQAHKFILYALMLLIMLITSFASANALTPDYIISNSEAWQDVYSTILYANLMKTDNGFLVSERAATLLLNTIDRKNQNIQIISSSKTPFIIGYRDIVAARDFTVEELSFADVNLELAKRLPDITKFIIIDDSYGYNAISAAPYACLDQWYVLFADSRKISAIESFLSSRKVDKMLIYGTVDRAVIDRLAKYNPEIINKDGDRFENNIEMVKRYRLVNDAKQIIMTNGDFIEKEIMSGVEPVVFIGANNVPTSVQNYIKGTDITVAVLIGNDLVNTATYIRRQLGLSVFVKFAQGAREPQGAITQVEGLDLFYLPRYLLNLDVFKIIYNSATQQIEITYQNLAEIATYFKGTITLTDENGVTVRIGDADAVFIDAKDFKTMVYDVTERLQGNITAEIYTLFGESKKSLEKVLERKITIQIIEVKDSSTINITDLQYDKRRGVFMIKVQNIGSTTAYVDLELADVIINGIPTTLGLKEVAVLAPGESKWLEIEAILTEEDITQNRYITVKAYYGERKESLVKYTTATFELRMRGFDYIYYVMTYGIAILIAIILIFFIFFIRRRRKKKEEGEGRYSGYSGYGRN